MPKNKVTISDVPSSHVNLSGKTIVFTGGTDGMGRGACEKFARMGADVVLLGRNPAKTARVASEINAVAGTQRVRTGIVDFESMTSVRECAVEVLASTPHIDALVNCAGANFGERKMTDDGVERAWAVNHLGPFLLTLALLERLKKSAPARVVQLTSATQAQGHINLEDLTRARDWSTLNSYAQAKLAMIMCVQRLADELDGTGVTVNALNPGWIDTDLARGSDIKGPEKLFAKYVTPLVAAPTFTGSNRIITATIAPQYDGVSGKFIYEDYVRTPNKEAQDASIVDAVWDISKQQTGLA